MRNFLQISETLPLFNQPWLVLGKGPSFSKIFTKEFKFVENFNIFGLNHAAQFYPCTISHFIDYDVVNLDIVKNSKRVIVPFHGHIRCKVQFKNLYHFISNNVHFNMLEEKDVLYWYNCSTYKGNDCATPKKPIITAKYFSSEAAFRILAHLGISRIYSLGIDGGKEYANEFLNAGYTPLVNGQKNFDLQIPELEKICSKFHIDWTRL